MAESLRTGEHPERYSSFIVPESFDRDAFDKNPQEYADAYAKVVEPGRVFATAQPQDGVMALRSSGSRFHRLFQGETVRLSVQASPFAPVSYTSFGFGQFDNDLTSITIVADETGVATAEFFATSGTKNEIKILAGSPVLSDQVTFVVHVKKPE